MIVLKIFLVALLALFITGLICLALFLCAFAYFIYLERGDREYYDGFL